MPRGINRAPTAHAQHELPVVGHIGGACYAVAVSGNYAFIGEGPSLRALDIADAANPAPAAKLLFDDLVRNIFISGSYAYVAADTAGLRVVDIEDLANPTETGYYDTPGTAVDVFISGSGRAQVEDTVTAEQKAAYNKKLAQMLEAPNRYTEEYRPQFHFTPIFNWMNDPNGLVHYEGEYHLFFQHNPFGRRWGNMSWGHAVSPDLVHWKQLPIALWPDDLGTIFSGSAVVDPHDTSGFFNGGSGLVAIFTHHHMNTDLEQQGIAYSRDKGRTWTKYEGNPVIPNVGDRDFRDPKVFWHESTKKWIMIVAGGKVRFYSSPNLRDWTFESINEEIGTECPDFFELPVDGDPNNTKWVLSKAGRGYLIGEFDGHAFTPDGDEIEVMLSPGPYASQTWSDIPAGDGRRIIIDWMRPIDSATRTIWTSSMTLPRVVGLKTFPGSLGIVHTPVEELETLRGQSWKWKNETVSPRVNLLDDVRGQTLEIVAEFELDTAREFGFRLRKSKRKLRKDKRQETVVGYDVAERRLFVDRTKSGAGRIDDEDIIMETQLPPVKNKVELHIFVDWSVVDVFPNDGRRVFSSPIHPDPSSDGLELYCEGGNVKLRSLEVYELKSIWRD